jgi:hypothetical protein
MSLIDEVPEPNYKFSKVVPKVFVDKLISAYQGAHLRKGDDYSYPILPNNVSDEEYEKAESDWFDQRCKTQLRIIEYLATDEMLKDAWEWAEQSFTDPDRQFFIISPMTMYGAYSSQDFKLMRAYEKKNIKTAEKIIKLKIQIAELFEELEFTEGLEYDPYYSYEWDINTDSLYEEIDKLKASIPKWNGGKTWMMSKSKPSVKNEREIMRGVLYIWLSLDEVLKSVMNDKIKATHALKDFCGAIITAKSDDGYRHEVEYQAAKEVVDGVIEDLFDRKLIKAPL